MQKRVLAFLLVMVMVLSLLPVSLVGAETETATPAYAVIFQKAHNQTEGSLAIDVYLQATVASEITGYQLEVTPADGLTLTGIVDNTGNDNVKASGTTVVYDPAGLKPITVGTAKVLVATVTVTGETLPANVGDAITVTNALVTTAEAQYTPELTALDYGCTDHTCGHGTGEWKALTQADLDALYNSTSKVYFLGTGNYYLTEDIVAAYKTYVSEENAKINLCLNGYTFTSPTADKLLEVGGKGAEVNFCDCTATGEGENLVAGKFLLKYYNWGNFRLSSANSKLTCTNVIVEGAEDAVSYVEGNANVGNAATFYQGTSAAGSSIYVENVLIKDVNASKTVIDTRAEGYYKNVTFVNCSGGENSAEDQLAIFATNGSPASTGTRALTIDGCKFIDCEGDILDTNQKSGITFTLKGDVQAEGAFYITKSCKVNLELGDNADVTIRTEVDKTEETFGTAVVIPEGATLPAGTLLYKNVDMLVEYKDGTFSWVGHAHKAETFANGTEEGHTVEGLSFKAWDDSTSLPTDGNWYLITDVALSARPAITDGNTLNLDLNGHTVKQTKATTAIFEVQGGGTLNLFDCQGGYDEAGKWTGGKLTGGTGGSGGAVLLQPGVAGTERRAVFNMYGGSISGNHTASSGGAVYVGYSRIQSEKNRPGAQFNMYAGEIANNTSDNWGGAITIMGYSHTATSGTVGLDPALGLGGQFNMHGGKIYGNLTERATQTTGYAEGTIHVEYDGVVNMTGGEIYNNTAGLGGAFFMIRAGSKINITGGKIYNNTAVESEYQRSQFKYTTNDSGQVTSHTVYMGKGGAIYCTAGTLVVQNAEITGNTSTLGGAFYLAGGSATKATIENCVIDGNTARDPRTAKFAEDMKNTSNATYSSHNQEWGNGGAAYIYSGPTTATFKNCQITNNVASEAANNNAYSGCTGGIYTYYTKNLVIDGCNFDGNVSTNKCGGALNLRGDNTVADVRNCTFTNNTAGNAGGAIYTVNGAILKLTDTMIYNNANTGTNGNGGGVYITSKGGRIILSGKVVIDQNTYKGTHGVKTDLFFQNQTTRTYLAEVNELGAGSSINMYFDTNATSTIITEDKAESYVKLTDGGTQSDWDCGWISAASKANTTPRQIAYIDLTDDGVDNKTFEWGHYHKAADGTYYELTAWTDAGALPDAPPADGYGYYLTKDVTFDAAGDRTEYRPGAHAEREYDLVLCLNGHDVTVPSNVTDAAIVLRSVNAWIGDCTASFDNNGHLISGSTIKGAHKSENGGGMYFTDDDNIGTNVTLYGIELNGCYETVKRNGTVSPGYAGGGIHARNKSVTVDQTDITIIGCKFTGNYTNMEGGAINSLNGADFTITDTVFENNHSGRYGGAISMIGATGAKGELKLDNCRFIGNYTTSNPTAWTDDTATTDVDETVTPKAYTGLGGAIYATNTTVDVNNCYFEGNEAYNATAMTNITTDPVPNLGYGGAIYVTGGTVNVTGSYFEGNKAYNAATESNMSHTSPNMGCGGAIYVTSTGYVHVDGSQFVDNYALYEGGAIFVHTTAGNTVSDSVFDGNSAEFYGGAIFNLNSASGVAINGTAEKPVIFRNNTALGHYYTDSTGAEKVADGRGGAIESMNGTVSLSYAEFYNNTALLEGGAIRLGGGGGTKKIYSLDHCYFEGNKGSKGAGLFINAVTQEGTIVETDFVNNEASIMGGGLYLNGGTAKSGTTVVSVPNITITGGTFEGNSAASYSGALHVAQNTTLTANGVTFKGNESVNGGAVATGESAAKTYFDNCVFTENKGTTGGAIYHYWFGEATYTGCTFTNNTATTNGGAMNIKGNDAAIATIGGAGDAACTFTGNVAKDGGALWLGSNTSNSVYTTPTTSIINSTFTENIASNDVSAIKVCNAHQATITDSTITKNVGADYGALHVATSDSSLTLVGKVVVTDNVSESYVDFAENTDLFIQKYTDKNAKIDITGLAEGSSIGVFVQDARMADDQVITQNGGAAAFGYLFSNSERVILGTKDNEVIAGKYVAEDGTLYGSVQAAVEAAEAAGKTTIKLQAPTTETVTLTTLDYIDLNGFDIDKVVVPEGLTLTLVDTTTNDYDCSDGFGEVTVEGAYKAYAEDTTSGSLKRYVVIADADTGKLSAHRVYLAITAKTLRPTNAGVGFKAIFAGDEIVAENIVYGVQLSGYSDFSQVLAASFDTMEPGALTSTPNQKTVVIYDAITAENTSRWDADLYGRPFLQIGETTVYGKDVTVNMKSMAANALASGDQTVIDAVNEMMTKCGVSAN